MEQCESCRIIIGGKEEHWLFEDKREKLAGRTLSWEEFVGRKWFYQVQLH